MHIQGGKKNIPQFYHCGRFQTTRGVPTYRSHLKEKREDDGEKGQTGEKLKGGKKQVFREVFLPERGQSSKGSLKFKTEWK